MQDCDKTFKTLIAPKPLILFNSHSLQIHADTVKMYCLIQRDFFWKGMYKDIDKCIQNTTSANNKIYTYNHIVISI